MDACKSCLQRRIAPLRLQVFIHHSLELIIFSNIRSEKISAHKKKKNEWNQCERFTHFASSENRQDASYSQSDDHSSSLSAPLRFSLCYNPQIKRQFPSTQS